MKIETMIPIIAGTVAGLGLMSVGGKLLLEHATKAPDSAVGMVILGGIVLAATAGFSHVVSKK